MALLDQIIQLENSLEAFKSDERVDWQVGKMANAMIAQAKEQVQGNVIVDSIDPFQPGPNDRYVGNATAGTVRAVLRQVAGALPDSGPGIA